MLKNKCGEKDVKLLGAPMEDTLSFRPGARFAPQKIRQILPYLEYTTLFGNVAEPICDLGDVELLQGRPEENLARIEAKLKRVGPPFIMIGGEHTATLAALNVVRPDVYVHIDAHFDLRNEWPPGQRLSHATFARRAHEELGFYAIYIGVRAYDDEEREYAENAGFFVVEGRDFTRQVVADALSTASGRAYVSLDIDVLDPAEAPGVGTPEAGGLSFKKLEYLLTDVLMTLKPVAVDIMEYSPPNDVSDITATKVVRILMHMASLLKI
ncbi:agmatinase family protein [Pyrobaculum aerophilum]|uniref:Agmatinase (SpeB) n=2 Tax=Pyrobaculum aerophilum TaxID=13773 RepID=Q8ZVI7_PYRAE|nr:MULTISPECIES: agmatinase family protein [Pyrobaculum]AAL64069.1 agmatinase (speB) [Pyrobaculum aerophilum str. IM2]MCX8135815.1 agmatinase family protein [Pyrobaculum aerophilum]HII47167.1 agmatinase family protein [Pyrobaculum aerophilum]